MIWKGCLVLNVALCVLCERHSAYSEVSVKKYYKDHQGEVSKSDQKTTENHEEYAKAHPSYEFSYKVIDPYTHDKKGQQETRDGDKVAGHYWLIQPDGQKRLVNYIAGGKHGFIADINYALHDEYKHDSEQDVQVSEDENKDQEVENDQKDEDKPYEDIKEEIKVVEQVDNEPEKESIEFESKKIDERKEEKKIDDKYDESEEFDSKKIDRKEEEKKIDEIYGENDKKQEEKSNEAPNIHEKKEYDNKVEHKNTKPKEEIDLWAKIYNWGQIPKDTKNGKEDDIWSLPNIYTRGGEKDNKEEKKQEVHDERDNNEGNVWSWRKSYDVWEVKHQGGENKDGNDNKDKPIKEEQSEKRPKDDGSKRKGHRRNVGLRDYEYRGQPTYHMPIMKTKPIPYRRRIIVN